MLELNLLKVRILVGKSRIMLADGRLWGVDLIAIQFVCQRSYISTEIWPVRDAAQNVVILSPAEPGSQGSWRGWAKSWVRLAKEGNVMETLPTSRAPAENRY